jgi:hypothetical protein
MQISASTVPVQPSAGSDNSGGAAATGSNGAPAINASDNATIVQMKQFAAVLADGSTASLEDKTNAYVGLKNTIVAGSLSGATGGISKADADAISAIFENSSVSKQITQAANAFAQKGAAQFGQSKTVNIAGVLSDTFNKMSSLQQQMTYAGMATPDQSLDDYRQQLQHSAAVEAANMAADAAPSPAVKVTLSDAAKATFGAPAADDPTTDTGAKPASKALSPTTAGVTGADVALSMLQKASDAKAKADADQKTTLEAKATANWPYSTGDVLSTQA